MAKNNILIAATVLLFLCGSFSGYAQTIDRQHKLDSLKEVIEEQKGGITALREYIGILGLSDDGLKAQFSAWIRQYPKSAAIPYAMAEAYYKARDPQCTGYIIKAYMAGDTAKRLIRMLRVAEAGNWLVDVPRTAGTVDSLKRVVENNPDSLLPVQQYIFVLGTPNDTAVAQIDAWMKQFPKSAAIPYAMGEGYYSDERPEARPYLLRVTALEPANAKVWEMLSIDASRWGNDKMASEYMGKAAAAAPDNVSYAASYAYSFKKLDPAMWRKQTWELAKRFPHDDKAAASLSWIARETMDKQEKRNILEQLMKLYPPAEFASSAGAMGSLYDLYLQEGLTDKAIELAASMGDKEGFSARLKLAKSIAAVRAMIKGGKYKEAQQEIVHIKAPPYSDAATMIVLLKAEVMDAAGSTRGAYDSLLVVQTKTPADEIRDAITKYGARLGKSAAQAENDIRTIRDKNSRPAPPFELGLYTSDAKARLEDYRGKVVLLTFWFPGCGPCRGEMPHFQNVVNKFGKKDLAYLGINVSPEQDEYVLPFMKGTKYSFTPLRGNGKWAEEVYHVRGEPTNFLIDRDGKIIYSGFMIDGNNERMLELMIGSLLAKK